MSKSIFFSWASDFNEQKSHKPFIINCLIIISKKLRIKNISILQRFDDKTDCIEDYRLTTDGLFEIQNATIGEKGSKNIVDVIFDRISKCSLYICDVSITLFQPEIIISPEKGPYKDFNVKMQKKQGGRLSPNPNVLIELGYAMCTLNDWEKIILLFDKDEYKVEDLPFDIRQHIPILFEGKKIEKELNSFDSRNMNIDTLCIEYQNRKHIKNFLQELESKIAPLDSPIEDYMQEQIDSILFCYLFSFSNMLYSLDSSLNDANSFLQISKDKLESLIDNCDGGIFHIINTIDLFCEFNPHTFNPNFMPEIDRVYQNLTSSTLYEKKWITCFISFQKYIRRNYKVLIMLFNRDGFKHYDIKQIKNDFISLLLDFQGIVIEWLKLTKRNNLETILPIFLPQGGENQLDFSDNEKRRKYCYLELNKCKYFYSDRVKHTLD